MTRSLLLLALLLLLPARAQIDPSIFDGSGRPPAGEQPPPPPSGQSGNGGGETPESSPENGGAEEGEGEAWIPASPETIPGGEEEGEAGQVDTPPAGGEGGDEEGTPEMPGMEGELVAPLPPETEEPPDPGPGGRATEVFQPTERIPADQSVDFPWDI